MSELHGCTDTENDRFKTYKKEGRDRTYLADEIIREFEETSKRIVKSPSRTQNFVRKLVATLERKGNESGECSADDEFLTKCYTKSDCLDRSNDNSGSTPEKLLNSSYTQSQTLRHEKESDTSVLIDDFAKKSATLPTNVQTPNKKVARKRSFKSFLSVMIGRKKPSNERKPRRFHSCDNLDETSPRFGRIIVPDFSKASSVQIVPFEDLDEHFVQNRSVTIHPIRYRERRSQEPLQTFGAISRQKIVSIRNNQDSDFLPLKSLDDTSEDLIRPSAVKDMARRFSLLPERSVEYSRCTLREKLNNSIERRVSRRNGLIEDDFLKPTKATPPFTGSASLQKEYLVTLNSENETTHDVLSNKTAYLEKKKLCKGKPPH